MADRFDRIEPHPRGTASGEKTEDHLLPKAIVVPVFQYRSEFGDLLPDLGPSIRMNHSDILDCYLNGGRFHVIPLSSNFIRFYFPRIDLAKTVYLTH